MSRVSVDKEALARLLAQAREDYIDISAEFSSRSNAPSWHREFDGWVAALGIKELP
jgi:hypothetical protein